MTIAVLYPRFDHPAIEERFASWQSQMRLRREHAGVDFYDTHEAAADVVADVKAEHVLVVTDPLVVAPLNAGARLRDALEASGAEAAVPVMNEARHPRQQKAAEPYVTLRELELVQTTPAPHLRVTWDDSDPALYLCRRDLLRGERAALPRALRGRDVAIDSSTYVHVWSALRGQVRDDLLPYIPTEARSILELGCGEGALGALVKQRQKCRVVGVELDQDAALAARKRIDDVYTGDVRHIIELIHERFDCIVASEIIEHLDDPWSLLADLRRISAPGGRLVISIPNMANASIIGDLIAGRFDYTYIGLLCAGHLRFFTRASIRDLLDIAEWRAESIVPQRAIVSSAAMELVEILKKGGARFDEEELLATGYYVIAS